MIYFLFSISAVFVKLPAEDEFELLENGFRTVDSMPNTILAIDGTYIPINIPNINGEECFNRKGFYNINVIVTADYKKRFKSVSSHLGSALDSRVVSHSRSLINFMCNLYGYNIVGDQAYLGYQKIVIPVLCESVYIKNYSTKIGIQNIIVENAFGLFKKYIYLFLII